MLLVAHVRSTASVLALGFALAVGLVATRARAQVIDIVELKDGSQYQGQLVEKVEGIHVVIQLATGEVKTFLWDDVARVTPAPAPAPALAPAPSPVASAPADATAGLELHHVYTGWSAPGASPETPSPSSPRETGQQLDLGLVTSLPQFGSPRGIAGLMTEYQPVPWLGLEVAGAYDGPAEVAEGNLGWSLAETLRVGHLFGVGAGVSQHFGATGNGVAHLGHAELFWDLDMGDVTLRMATGAATMFNGADHPGACGFYNISGGGMDDSGRPNDTSCAFVYFDVEVFFHLPLGGG